MPFPISERLTLLAVKGVGPTVVFRLEQMGIESLAHLAKANALDIVSNAAKLLGSTCWKNSPQARAAIQSAISAAQAVVQGTTLPASQIASAPAAKKTVEKSATKPVAPRAASVPARGRKSL